MFEMNTIGSVTTLTRPAPFSGLPMRRDAAIPSVVNAAAPSASVASIPIIFSPGTCAPNSGTPAANSRTIDSTSTISVEPTAPR